MILKRTVPPGSTLVVVAKPSIALFPTYWMSHSLAGVPGLLFSQATGLPPAPHGSAVAAEAGTGGSNAAAHSTATRAARRPPTDMSA